jgi:hypothetical protein
LGDTCSHRAAAELLYSRHPRLRGRLQNHALSFDQDFHLRVRRHLPQSFCSFGLDCMGPASLKQHLVPRLLLITSHSNSSLTYHRVTGGQSGTCQLTLRLCLTVATPRYLPRIPMRCHSSRRDIPRGAPSTRNDFAHIPLCDTTTSRQSWKVARCISLPFVYPRDHHVRWLTTDFVRGCQATPPALRAPVSTLDRTVN